MSDYRDSVHLDDVHAAPAYFIKIETGAATKYYAVYIYDVDRVAIYDHVGTCYWHVADPQFFRTLSQEAIATPHGD
jgi:hypothetical protein